MADPRASIHLRRTEEDAAGVEAVAAQLGRRVGLAGVLGHLNRQAERHHVRGRLVDWGFRWNAADGADARWYPQGITTSADAHPSEELDGHPVLLTSWYATGAAGGRKGSRVTVVDLASLRYRHVMLVRPHRGRDGRLRLRPVEVHAGGLLWTGPHLHVAGTRRGLVTCAVDDVVRLHDPTEASGYRYVLPVRCGYDAAAAEGVERMRYSFVSLDRSGETPHLLAGEYGRGEMTRRLVRYPLDPVTGHLSTRDDGTSRPVWLDERGMGHMQGAVVVDGTWFVTTSRGPRRRGQLHVGRPGAFRTRHWALPPGPEDITWWPSTDRLWSLSEHPGRRAVFCVPRERALHPRGWGG